MSRIIVANNCNLEDMVEEGKFRADLYYSLHILPIRIPPLRERKEDIFCLEVLQNHHWPGNVRELENIIEQLVIMAKENEITIQDLPKRLLDSTCEQGVSIFLNAGNSLHEVL
ncbi:sigma 54-interacting transcriptional regulator [Peribacillus sp. NPDC060186]